MFNKALKAEIAALKKRCEALEGKTLLHEKQISTVEEQVSPSHRPYEWMVLAGDEKPHKCARLALPRMREVVGAILDHLDLDYGVKPATGSKVVLQSTKRKR